MPLFPRQHTSRADAPVCPGCHLRFEPETDRDVYCCERCKKRVGNRQDYQRHIDVRREKARKRKARLRKATKQPTP